MTTLAAGWVRHLIVVLQEGDERGGLQPEPWRATALLLPCVPLALVEITPFDGGDKLLRLAQMVGIVSLIMSGQRHHRAMMKIVIPERVDAIASLLLWPHQLHVLRLVLRHDDGCAPAGHLAYAPRYGGKDMIGRLIIDILRRIKPQAVEVEFFNPVTGIGKKELTHRPGVLAIEVDRLSPLCGVAVGEVILGKLLEIIAIRPHVIIDHIENDANFQRMRPINKAAKIIRLAIESRRREEIHPVIAPTETAGKLCYWHDLQHRDAGL